MSFDSYQDFAALEKGQPADRKTYGYKEILRTGREDLDSLKQRVIRELYLAAVKDGKYPVSKPKVTLSSEFWFTQRSNEVYVLAEVETL